jgi:hypothetical protein
MKILLVTAFLAMCPLLVSGQTAVSPNTDQNTIYTIEHNWGWVGLLGLAGLAGLRRPKSATAAKWESQGVNVKEVKG